MKSWVICIVESILGQHLSHRRIDCRPRPFTWDCPGKGFHSRRSKRLQHFQPGVNNKMIQAGRSVMDRQRQDVREEGPRFTPLRHYPSLNVFPLPLQSVSCLSRNILQLMSLLVVRHTNVSFTCYNIMLLALSHSKLLTSVLPSVSLFVTSICRMLVRPLYHIPINNSA